MGSGNLEHALDLDRRIRWQRGDADRGSGMAPLVAEGCNHQIRGAVQHLWPIEEIGRGVDEAAEPYHAHDLVEVAECGLDLRQQVDPAGPRGSVALLDGDAGAELALGDKLAIIVHTDL